MQTCLIFTCFTSVMYTESVALWRNWRLWWFLRRSDESL